MENLPAIFPSYISILALGFLPFLVVMGTSYTKIAIVLMLLRNALGVQQAPSGIVINSIALIMTLFIMAPLGEYVVSEIDKQNLALNTWEDLKKVYGIVSGSYSKYLKRFIDPREMDFFMQAAYKIWPESLHDSINDENFFILLPAHITSELQRAFEIAFLIFLPFLVVDLVVSNILLAMGAMMVSPILVSMPLKILLFVAADGWGRLLHALIMSYA